MAEALSRTEVLEALESLDGWSIEDGKLHKEYLFDDFVGAFGFLCKVGLHAERANHHPEIANVYNRVTLELTSHDVGGITDRDIRMARTIDGL